ncbi:MAG: tripartite tricarboxylate transporter substrate binding protein [Betaproteobacteria bacterium]|nr:tripartite tricarboxylate transporter substrate binding protein [Betaproteobacteria bacterium]
MDCTGVSAVRVLALCAALLLASELTAQTYPGKPVRVVVPYAAGGPVDTVARLAAQKLTGRWGQQVIVDNRAGSGGAIGTQAVVKAPPDGYTLLVGNSGPITVYPHMRKSLLYDFERDLAPASFMVKSCMVLVTHPSLPSKTVQELVRLAKREPGALSYASSGVGGVQHLGMVLLESRAGIKLVHVPYKGAAPALADLISGQVHLQFNNVVGALGHVQSGKLRALGVSTATPSAVLPNVPPVARAYPGFDVASWMGVYAPAGTPKPVIDQLTRDVAWALNQPDVKQRLTEVGAEVVAAGPAELGAYMRNESALFGKLIAAAGIPKE